MPDPVPERGPHRPPPAPGRRRGKPSLVFHLALLCFVLLAPLVFLSGVILHGMRDAERERLWRAARSRAHAISTVLERDLTGHMAALRALATSPSLDEALLEPVALESFARQARAMEPLLGGRIALASLASPPALPAAAPGEAPPGRLEAEVARRGRPVLSDLEAAPGGHGFRLRLGVPVLRDGAPAQLLTLDLDPDRLREHLLRANLPDGWLALLVDAEGRLIARTDRQEEFQGRVIQAALALRDSQQTRLWQTRSLTGEMVLVGHALSELSGWRIGVLVPARLAEEALRRSWALVGIGFLLLALLAAGLALLFAHRIAEPVQALVRAAEALGRGQSVQLPPIPVRELDEVGGALAEASTVLRSRAAALAESEARLARALKAGRIATWEWEAAGDTLTGSPGREALYGQPAGTLRDRAALLAVTHPEDHDRLRAAMAAALDPAGSGLYDVKFRIIRPGGAIRWLRSQGGVVERDAAGHPLRLSGVVMDITAAQLAMERERVLVSEVDHRARNVLTVVQSILRLSRADDPAVFAETVRGRVSALARAHTLLARERWSGGEWHALLRETLSPYLRGGRLLMQGPPLTLAAPAVQPLAMLLHELASNAARHGALSHGSGQVALSWTVQDSLLSISWTERGGAPIPAPPVPGFGLRMLDTTIRRQLGGTVELNWTRSGLACRIRLPEARTLRDGSLPPETVRPSDAARARFG